MNKILKFLATRPNSQLTLLAIVLGFGYGLLIKQFEPSREIFLIVSLIGDLFLNSLKNIVIIFVVIIMIRTPIEMNEIAKAKSLAWISICYYLLTSFFAATMGLIFANIIKPGSREVLCALETSARIERKFEEKSFIDSIISLFKMTIPSNVLKAILESNILAIIFFFLIFGFLLTKYSSSDNLVIFKNTVDVWHDAIIDFVHFIIFLTPVGVFSLIAGQMSRLSDNCILMKLLIYMLVFLGCNLLQCFVVLPLIYFSFVRKNPYKYISHYFSAVITAFSTSSSAAALPLNIQGAYKSGIDKNIANFVLSLGATLNMNGSSLYYPITIIFISFMYKKSIDWGTQFLMCFITAFVTVGNAPIPSGSFVYLLLVGNAVGIHLPAEAVSLIFAVDPIMDRIITATNVCGDSFAVAIIEVLNKRLNKRRKVKENVENNEKSSTEKPEN